MDINEFIELESAQERFMNNEDLYKKFLLQFPDRTLYPDLKKSLESEDISGSFEIAHSMKGVVLNLSLNRLGKKICEIVEILRKDALPDASLQKELSDAYEDTIKNINYIKDNNIKLFN